MATIAPDENAPPTTPGGSLRKRLSTAAEGLLLAGAKPIVEARFAEDPQAPASCPAKFSSPNQSLHSPFLEAPTSCPNPASPARSSCASLAQFDAMHTEDLDDELPKLEADTKDNASTAFCCGLVLANLATIAFSLQMLCVKLAAQDGPPSMQLLLVRFVLHSAATFACCALGLFGFHGRFWYFSTRKSALLCAATGIVNTVVIQLLYFATTQLSLALATVIYFTSPMWTGVLKTVLLGDAYSIADGAFSCLSVCAVAIVVLPHQEAAGQQTDVNTTNATLHQVSGQQTDINAMGIASALAAGGLQALAYVIVQVLKRREDELGQDPSQRVHWLQINVSNAIFGAIFTPLALWGPLAIQQPVSLMNLSRVAHIKLFGIGVFTVLAQFMLVQSQGYLDVCLVTVIRTLDVMYALSYQSVFFDHMFPTLTDVAGCLLLMFCCAGSALHTKWVAQKLAAKA